MSVHVLVLMAFYEHFGCGYTFFHDCFVHFVIIGIMVQCMQETLFHFRIKIIVVGFFELI